MKALTLTQPWASLVAYGAKRIETRSWSTSYRGTLAIHAAKGFPKAAMRVHGHILWEDEPAYPLGVVLATCRLADCLRVERSVFGLSPNALSEQEKAFGDYTPGRWAWILAQVQPLATPIPAKGALGLWEFEFQGEIPYASL
jgi:hypothetical protein